MREMLQALTSIFEASQLTVISEIKGPAVKAQPKRFVPSTWPPFRLPYEFVPQAKGVPEMGQTIQQARHLPIFTDAHPVIHIVAPLVIHTRNVPHFEDQHYIYHTVESSIRGDEGRYEDFGEVKEGFQTLEKIFQAIQEDQVFGATAKEMCLVFGLVISVKLKTLDFDKYKGHTCPKSHLIMYYRKMVAHMEDDKLMILYFQNSLNDAPSKWYLSLKYSIIKCF